MRAAEPEPAWVRPAGRALWVLALGALVAVLSLHRMSNNDIWLHLKTGEIILDEGAIPMTERFSFTVPGRPLVPHEWGAAVIFALVHGLAGVPRLILLRCLLAAATVTVLVLTARSMGARLPIVTLPLALALLLASSRLLVRPHLWSFLLGGIFLYVLDRHRRRGGRLIFLLIPLQALWANLHGGFPLGWFLTGAYLVAELLPVLTGKGLSFVRERRQIRRLGALAIALPLVCMLNPSGYHLLLFPFQVTGVETFMESVYEWQPPFTSRFRSTYMFREYLLLAGLALAGLWLRLRWGARVVMLIGVMMTAGGIRTESDVLLISGLAVLCAALMSRQGTPPLAHGLVIVGTFYLSTRMNRAVTDFALMSLPAVAACWDRWLRRRRWPVSRLLEQRPGLTAASCAIVLIALAGWLTARGYWFDVDSRREGGIGLARSVPVGAMDFLERNGIGGRVLADYSAAAYLIWRLHPSAQVFFDSRNEVYGEAIAREFHAAKRGGAALSGTLDRHDVDTVVVHLGKGVAMLEGLQRRRDFPLIYFDDQLAIYSRRNTLVQAASSSLEYRNLSPLSLTVGTSSGAIDGVIAEAHRAMENCRDCMIPRAALAEMAFQKGDLEGAEDLFAEIVGEWPELFLPWLRMGDIHGLRGEVEQAQGSYEKALQLRPGDPEVARRLEFLRRVPSGP